MEKKDIQFSQFIKKQKNMKVRIQDGQPRLCFRKYQTRQTIREISMPWDENKPFEQIHRQKKKIIYNITLNNKQKIGKKGNQ
ncbi:hypothetical protein pb186bvf_003796 [Paramecium bursaria]